jgi:outer membrane protein TolC
MKILYLIRKSYFSGTISKKYALLFAATSVLSIAKGQMSASNFNGSDTSSVIEEKLVQLALQGPEMQNTAHLTKIREYELKATQNVWMNTLALSGSLNDQTFNKNNAQAIYFPKFSVGVAIPLGVIFSKTAVKSARENVEIGKNNTELLKRDIREQVLTAYKEYVALSNLIAIQNELSNDVKIQLAQIEEKFRKGSISIETYSLAQKNNNTELANLINLRLQQDLKKLELEKLIGVKLETVLNK